MADSELIAITEDTTPDSTDYMYGVDSAGAVDKRYSIANLAASTAWSGAYAPLPKLISATYTGGDITANSASWANVNTGLDLVVPAAAGDLVGLSVFVFASSVTASVGFDMATIVSGSPVNYLVSAGSNSHFGVPGWICITAGPGGRAGEFFYVVQSGDISAGNVTFRLRYRGGSATLKATTDIPLITQAVRYGQES